MIDAIVGSIIMMAASLSLVLAIEIAERSINSAGAQPLSLAEQAWLKGDLNSVSYTHLTLPTKRIV